MTWTLAALYRFVDLPDHKAFAAKLREHGQAMGLRGTFIVAPEGLNGTVAGTAEAIDATVEMLQEDARFAALEVKRSTCEIEPFSYFKVREKPEIVTFRQPQVDATGMTGEYVEPADWNDLIADPEVKLVDTRNAYEIKVGRFEGAIDPHTESFPEFAEYVREHLDPARDKKVAMYCTGGIRCEKATAFLRQEGFSEVYHLKGGILRYLEEVPEEKSRWQGDCWVFDNRVAVNHRLEQGTWSLCPECDEPIQGTCPGCQPAE